METQRNIETVGWISKEETIATVNYNVIPNTLVLESEVPYPGYYGANLPTGTKPGILYLVLDKKYPGEVVIRASAKIKRYAKFAFDATPGSIRLHNSLYHCIRVRGLEDFDPLPNLQTAFSSEGFGFLKYKKLNDVAQIWLKKFFYLDEPEKGIFKDLEDDSMWYLQVPQPMSWSFFVEITSHIKRNNPDWHFDAAIGVIYLKGVIDIARVYTRDMDIDSLRSLRDKYLAEIEKYS